jgi:hypothetical protein
MTDFGLRRLFGAAGFISVLPPFISHPSLFLTPANQAIVPTPMSVTPAAGAPVAPDTGAAHL